MTQPKLLIFDDGRGRWGPMVDRRPVFDLRSGAATTRERIERVLGRRAAALRVPDRLAAVCAERNGADGPAVNAALEPDPWLMVNGRWNGVQHAGLVAQLAPGRALLEADGDVVAVCVEADVAGAWRDAGVPSSGALAGLARTELPDRVLLGRPWHLLDELPDGLGADLAASTLPMLRPSNDRRVHIVGDHPVRVAEDATILPGVVLNADAGAIVIDSGAKLNAFVSIEGPCYVGPRSTLAAHASLRPLTVIGPGCKIGGEVSAAIVHGYSNKAHLGYLGNSLVGEWCNLGADTNVSNLKNTYGPVRIQLDHDGPAEDTGRMFHGPVLGDFVRTAIGTRLLTGSVVGTGCMLACSGYAPKCAPPFSFITDAGQADHDIDRLLETAQRMTARHHGVLSDVEVDVLRALHAARPCR